jgi:hypothetical protein
MKLIETFGAALLVSVLLVALPGCEKQGPLEEAGEAIDDTIEDAGDAIEDATDRN